MAPSLSTSLKLPRLPHLPSFPGRPGSRSGDGLVGLDIQPGFVAAVKARVNGSVLAERAAARPLDGDTVREGEVVDVDALTDSLRELFSDGALGKRVRVGIANQRTVMRTLDLPPVTDRKELAAAVRFQAQDQVPMPLSNAVIDFHPLGLIDTPAGQRQRVVLVAAQRDMVERLLKAVRAAGLTPEGVDLSAFALIRSLHDREDDEAGRVLYLNVDGLTNLAIAEGTVCRFTRVVGGGVEAMAAELASRREISLADARALLASVDLSVPLMPTPSIAEQPRVAPARRSGRGRRGHESAQDPSFAPDSSHGASAGASEGEPRSSTSAANSTKRRNVRWATPRRSLRRSAAAEQEPAAQEPTDADVRSVLENGVRELVGEIRNSLDFHRTQEQGGEVSHVALSGAVLDLPGFPEALQTSLGMEVRKQDVGLVDARPRGQGLHAPALDRGRPRDSGGAAMKAVNLIPSDERRRGGSVGAGRSQGVAYVVLGALAGIALLVAARRRRSPPRVEPPLAARDDRRGNAARAGICLALTPYTSFIALRETRMKAVAEVVDSRFDWAHAFHELGRVLPRDASITSLDGTVGAAGSTSGSSSSSSTLAPQPVPRRLPAACRRSRSAAARAASRRSR